MDHLQQPVTVNLPDYARMIDSSLSIESMDLVSSIPEFFNNKLSVMVDFFKTKKSDMTEYSTKNMNVYFKELHKNRYVLNKAMGTIEYAKVKRRTVPVVSGINVDVLVLATTIKESTAIINETTLAALEETTKLIARLVTDSDFRLSSRPVIIDPQYTGAVKVLTTNISNVLSAKKISDTRKVQELLPSIPHLEQAIEIALGYGSSSELDVYNNITKAVTAISNYTETLHTTFKEEKNVIKKQRIVEVAEYLQTAADLVTQSVNTMYLSNQSVIIMNNLVHVITK